MHNQLYTNIATVLNPSAQSYDLGMSIATITNTDLAVRQLQYDGATYIARKDRHYNLEDKDSKNAIIMIVDKNSSKISIKKVTDKFILNNIQKEKSEKVQITETFDEDFPSIIFFGKKTSVYAFTGTLYNTNTDSLGDTALKTQWLAGFELYWKENLRGSVLAKENQIAVMIVDDTIMEGYPINLTIHKTSANDLSATFSMSWIILKDDTLLDKNALRKYMFFQDDTDLKKTFEELQTAHSHLTLFNDFMYEVDRQSAQQGGLSPVQIDITVDYFIDRGITEDSGKPLSFQWIESTNDDGTKTYRKKYITVNFTKPFKSAMSYITDLMTSISNINIFSLVHTNLNVSIPDVSWSNSENIGSISLSEDTINGLYTAKTELDKKVEFLTQKYNQLLSEL